MAGLERTAMAAPRGSLCRTDLAAGLALICCLLCSVQTRAGSDPEVYWRASGHSPWCVECVLASAEIGADMRRTGRWLASIMSTDYVR